MAAAARRRRLRSKPSRRGASERKRRYLLGFDEGYREGVHLGLEGYKTAFEGTSIVIPSYNQLDMTRQCVNSIMRHTHTPYEIIVVDNASTDGTGAYLQSLAGQIRYRLLEANRGFAGAINVGLMMAKGSTIVLLNNDTLATDNWLSNMLNCLYSDASFGMVGPVTNYISGSQQIPVPYADVADMPAFARRNNVSDPARWRVADHLTGFCLLLRRELFLQVGYFDEGFEIGNFEDNDYNIRVRMLGKKLVVAQDSFIHHFGSVSMKALGKKFMPVNNRNEQYFTDKWPDANRWLDELAAHPAAAASPLRSAASFYPENIAVRGIAADVYWIEQGRRRPIIGDVTVPVNRVSQVDLRRWPQGEPISAADVALRWRGLVDGPDWGIAVFTHPDGSFYHLEGGRIRKIVGQNALQGWNLHLKPSAAISAEMLSAHGEGLPIVSPLIVKYGL